MKCPLSGGDRKKLDAEVVMERLLSAAAEQAMRIQDVRLSRRSLEASIHQRRAGGRAGACCVCRRPDDLRGHARASSCS